MAVAMKYGGGNGGRNTGVTMTLLWTNPDPTSSFAAQTVSADLSGYSFYGIVPIFSTATPNIIPMQVFPCDDSQNHVMTVTARSNNNNGGRQITFSTSGLTFGAGTYSGSSNNSYAIPYKIYGIKGIS